VAIYVAVMVLIGFHLRHGISSACQSLGAGTLSQRVVVVGTIIAILIAGGFAIIPIWVFLTR
jgi:succinate dehydrogenase / fumarate reductase cytochrome b subunit